jgi:hypothetical protein
MAGNQECKSAGHALHLCALKACGLDVEGNSIFAKLVEDPQFVCETCGDKANKAENLCKPKKIQA